jgi:DNA-binding response OmpR family regulator
MSFVAEVLVVDDDDDIRTMLRITLEGSGFAVREAADGYAALAALEEHAPDCMVLDLMMPKLDGFGVLKSIRQRDLAPRTRVLILTCKVEERDFARGWELGADEYLTKPFDPEWLAHKLDELLHTPPDLLRRKREEELQKAELLDRLESAFNRPRAAR